MKGWDVTEPLYLSCNGDKLLSRVQKSIVDAMSAELAALDRA